jgi:hypothetical protein
MPCNHAYSWNTAHLSWSYGSWIDNHLWNQCLSPLTLPVWILLRWGVLDTTLCDKVCQSDKVSIFSWFVHGLYLRVRFMVFNTTFNNISVISWRSVLLLEEIRVPRENHQPLVILTLPINRILGYRYRT